ncbi:hypothetical protein QYM36_010028, partial [Artemia franciscana]
CLKRKKEKGELLKDITTALVLPPLRPPPPVSSAFGSIPVSLPGVTQPTMSAQQPQGSSYSESLPYRVQFTRIPQSGYPYSPYGQVYLVNRVLDPLLHIPEAGPQMKQSYEDSYKQQQNPNKLQ